jgi:ribosome-associated protein
MDFETIRREALLVAVRSRGPGGQNVNKVSSAAQLFWNYYESAGLDWAEKFVIGEKLANLINGENQIVLRSDEFRDLEQNKRRVFEKLESLLRAALFKPKPRRATKPTRASRARRREGKVKRSDLKKSRRKVDY